MPTPANMKAIDWAVAEMSNTEFDRTVAAISKAQDKLYALIKPADMTNVYDRTVHGMQAKVIWDDILNNTRHLNALTCG